MAERGRENRFLTRKLRSGYKRLRGMLTGVRLEDTVDASPRV